MGPARFLMCPRARAARPARSRSTLGARPSRSKWDSLVLGVAPLQCCAGPVKGAEQVALAARHAPRAPPAHIQVSGAFWPARTSRAHEPSSRGQKAGAFFVRPTRQSSRPARPGLASLCLVPARSPSCATLKLCAVRGARSGPARLGRSARRHETETLKCQSNWMEPTTTTAAAQCSSRRWQ